MSENPNQNRPFQHLGNHLKQLREKKHESVAEVSGAVEIDQDVLVRIERGEYCPTEDVLLLLFSHFDTKDEEAVRLWELAGYDQQDMPSNGGPIVTAGDDTAPKPIVMVMQQDSRILYTDMVNITANNYGVVMNFMQNTGMPDGQPGVVARIGMSREHAESIVRVLQQTLQQSQADPKSLPKPRKATAED